MQFAICNSLFLLLVLSSLAAEPNLVLTQIPTKVPPSARTRDALDSWYPLGSRVVLVTPPFQPSQVRVLSDGLVTAGDPVAARDGRSIFFVGKEAAGRAWQIYQSRLDRSRPTRLTDMPGGAFSPDVLADGKLVFISPVPEACPTPPGRPTTAVFAQAGSGRPARLTFQTANATDLTVLSDGRILVVTALGSAPGAQALFTANNDGTEWSLYAGRHDRALRVQHPRELGGRILYLASSASTASNGVWAEAVRTARPFSHEQRLFPFVRTECSSITDGGDGAYLASFEINASFAIFRLATNATALGQPFFDDPAWQDIEAVRLVPRSPPLGHISAMSPSRKTGALLCLDANHTTYRPVDGDAPKAAKIRVTTQTETGDLRSLGEVPVQADGSFMAEVPADTPLGFEALDAQGQILRRTPPVVWVRAGENRTCVGCHEPHGRSPRNHRPLATRLPAARLGEVPSAAGPRVGTTNRPLGAATFLSPRSSWGDKNVAPPQKLSAR